MGGWVGEWLRAEPIRTETTESKITEKGKKGKAAMIRANVRELTSTRAKLPQMADNLNRRTSFNKIHFAKKS